MTPLGYQDPAVKTAQLDTTTVVPAPIGGVDTVRENIQAYLPADMQMLMMAVRQLGETLLLLEKKFSLPEAALSVALAEGHPIIPVAITDSLDVVGNSSRPLRVDPIGTTPQPVSGTVNVSSSPCWSIGISSSGIPTPTPIDPIAALSCVILQDSAGKLWALGITANGLMTTTSIAIGAPVSLFLNDPGGTTSWSISVSTSGLLTITSIPFGNYPTSLSLSSSVPQLVVGTVTVVQGASPWNVTGTVSVQNQIGPTNFPAIQAVQFNDGVTTYDLRGLDAVLRAVLRQSIESKTFFALHAGGFMPEMETLPFLGG